MVQTAMAEDWTAGNVARAGAIFRSASGAPRSAQAPLKA